MKLSSVRKFQRGFTLIELLVVIGILGILAAALVATIDPFEQLKKARDSRKQNITVELSNALIRYNTAHERTPWEPGGTAECTGDNGVTNGNVDVGTPVSNLTDCLTDLIKDGELKQAFTTAEGLDKIYIVEPYDVSQGNTASDGSPAICYIPESKSGQNDKNTRYKQTGEIANNDCPGNLNGTTCYWCAE